eukprot:TRINITY_DN1932_c0_g1_i1.p1 TRINITY_DN1932_c0_g1~~TRINITY_DN1932_c0_g1_i1.p1  ORF type:complete len:909 (-),score=213.22 TRINITY_DN1932_c0_g1_i1:104-2830(-)
MKTGRTTEGEDEKLVKVKYIDGERVIEGVEKVANTKQIKFEYYRFNMHEANESVVRYRCKEATNTTYKCPAKIRYIKKEEVWKFGAQGHNHPNETLSKHKELNEARLKELKDFLHLHPEEHRTKVIQKNLNQRLTAEEATNPTLFIKLSDIEKERKKYYTPCIANIQELYVREEFSKTLDKQEFIRYLSLFPHFLVMYSSTFQLNLVNSSVLKNVEFIVHGTLKPCPTGICQLITLLMRKSDEDLARPIAWGLLQSKTKEDYLHTWKTMKDLIPQLNVLDSTTYFISDFEADLLNSIREAFPTATVLGCSTYWLKACITQFSSNTSEGGLAVSVPIQQEMVEDLKNLSQTVGMELTKEEKESAYMDLKNLFVNKWSGIEADFVQYMEHTWLNATSLFPPYLWARIFTCDSHLDFTDNIERWNRDLNDLVESCQSLKKLIEELKLMESKVRTNATYAISNELGTTNDPMMQRRYTKNLRIYDQPQINPLTSTINLNERVDMNINVKTNPNNEITTTNSIANNISERTTNISVPTNSNTTSTNTTPSRKRGRPRKISSSPALTNDQLFQLFNQWHETIITNQNPYTQHNVNPVHHVMVPVPMQHSVPPVQQSMVTVQQPVQSTQSNMVQVQQPMQNNIPQSQPGQQPIQSVQQQQPLQSVQNMVQVHHQPIQSVQNSMVQQPVHQPLQSMITVQQHEQQPVHQPLQSVQQSMVTVQHQVQQQPMQSVQSMHNNMVTVQHQVPQPVQLVQPTVVPIQQQVPQQLQPMQSVQNSMVQQQVNQPLQSLVTVQQHDQQPVQNNLVTVQQIPVQLAHNNMVTVQQPPVQSVQNNMVTIQQPVPYMIPIQQPSFQPVNTTMVHQVQPPVQNIMVPVQQQPIQNMVTVKQQPIQYSMISMSSTLTPPPTTQCASNSK